MAKLTNLQVMKGVEKSLSSDFTSRIPAITQQNLDNIGQTMSNYPVIGNEFVKVLTNQIIRTLFMTRPLTNRLEIFNQGDLEKYGKSLEMIYVDIIKGKDFSDRFGGSYEAELWSPESVNNVKVQYLTENSRLKYKVTVSDDMLAGAFKNEYGLSNLMNQLVDQLVRSYNYDMFLMTWRLIDKMSTKQISGIPMPVDMATSKEFTKKLKTIILRMGFPSNEYNEASVYTQSVESDLFIITTPEVKATIDVDLLATVFNMEKAEIDSKFVIVPEFADANRIALIVDRDKIQIYNTKTAGDSTWNGAGLFSNVFLHRWNLLGACNFANCVELRVNAIKNVKENMPYNVGLDGKDITSTEVNITIDEDGDVSKEEKVIKEGKKPKLNTDK